MQRRRSNGRRTEVWAVRPTREDIQTLRADLMERIGTFETHLTERVSTVETRLGDRMSRLEGQVMMLNRVSFLTLTAVVAGAVKILFFG